MKLIVMVLSSFSYMMLYSCKKSNNELEVAMKPYWTQCDIFNRENERMRKAFVTSADYIREHVKGIPMVAPIAGYNHIEGHDMHFRMIMGMLNQTIFNIFDVKIIASESTNFTYIVSTFDLITQYLEVSIHLPLYTTITVIVEKFCQEMQMTFKALKYLKITSEREFLITMPIVTECTKMVFAIAPSVINGQYEVVAVFNLLH